MNDTEIKWDECYDVLVIGSGAAGMTAALRAHDLGLNALVIGKSGKYGGTSAVSGGGIWISDNHPFSALGGSDSAEEAIAPTARSTTSVSHLEKHNRVRFEAQPHYTDYYPGVTGGKPGYRSMAPQPFDAAALGEEFMRMRAPSPGTMLQPRISAASQPAL